MFVSPGWGCDANRITQVFIVEDYRLLERREIDELKAHLAKVHDKKNMVANSLTLYKTGRKLIERCECAIRYREADLQALADAESLAGKALECFKHDYAKDHAEFLRGVGFLLEVDKACKALPCILPQMQKYELLLNASKCIEPWSLAFSIVATASTKDALRTFLSDPATAIARDSAEGLSGCRFFRHCFSCARLASVHSPYPSSHPPSNGTFCKYSNIFTRTRNLTHK